MKDAHVTLRLPSAIVRLLERIARAQSVSKSQVVREAVARYVSPENSRSPAAQTVTAAQLAARWQSLPRLDAEEAADLADDLARAKKEMPRVKAKWG